MGDEHPERQAARENNKAERNGKQGQRGDLQRRLRGTPAWKLLSLRSDECGQEEHDPIWLRSIEGSGEMPVFKALLLRTYSFQESMNGTKQRGESGCTRLPGAGKGCPAADGVPSWGEAGSGCTSPTPPSRLLTFLWVFSLGGFVCGLGPSCLCSWEWFPPGDPVSPSVSALTAWTNAMLINHLC